MNADEHSVCELNLPISDHSVPRLPAPDAGLARLLASLTPPAALTYSTPWVRVPVSEVPSINAEEAELHQQRASNIRLAGLTPKERERRNKPLDERSTSGERYDEFAGFHPWFTRALERAGVGWLQALVLAEWLTKPALDWFDLEQAAVNGALPRPSAGMARTTTDIHAPQSRDLDAYRHVAVAVLHDLGAETTIALGGYPEDSHRRASRLVWAGVLHGVTNLGGQYPERGAKKALDRGRRVLGALGAWPWTCEPDGALHNNWWTDKRIVEALDRWRQIGEVQEAQAKWRRADAAREAGLTKGP
jgi:hypothetical protein